MKRKILLIIILISIPIFIYVIIKRNIINNFKKSEKPNFQYTLEDCKKALDSINVNFHLHSGTALGAIRNNDFIYHDNDIDIGIFVEDYKDSIVEKMEKNNFQFICKYGNIKTGLEYKFLHKKYKVSLDIFFIYKDKNKMRQSIFECVDKKNKFKKGINERECLLYMNKYETIGINLFGKEYQTAPISFLEDRYGKDWKTPKIFGYFDGLENGDYKTVEKYNDKEDIVKNIYICWFQGFENSTEIVKKCVKSWKYYNPDWNIILLDNNNIKNYIDIKKEFGIDFESKTEYLKCHISDFIRTVLLKKYGGIWADATTFCVRPLDQWLNNNNIKDFFAFKRINEKHILSNWFLYSKKNGYIITEILDKLVKYIKNNNKPDNYFFYHDIVTDIYKNNEMFKNNWDKIMYLSAHPPHFIQEKGMYSKLCDEVKNHINNKKANLYKLTWKQDFQGYKEDSNISYLFKLIK